MSDLELLKKYLQNEIDIGGNKIFVFDKDYNAIEFKTIDALNEINGLQNQLQQKENIIKEVREYIEMHTPSDIGICGNKTKRYYTLGEDSVDHILEILDGENNDK